MKPTLFALALAASTAIAQSPADRAISTMQGSAARSKASNMLNRAMTEQIAPELYPGEMDDVGPQFLLAPTHGAASHKWFEVFTDAQLYYTSNALLTEKGNADTGLAVSTLFVQARHTLSEQWTAGLGLDYNRLLSRENEWAEFYTELVPSWYLERNFTFGENAALTAGLYGSYHWTHTDDPVAHINDRLDTSFGITYSYELAPSLVAQPYYRIQWSHYTTNSDRNDMYHTLGFGLSYAISEKAIVRTFIGYENRNSTDTLIADYGKWDSGAGLTLNVQF